MKTGYVYKLCCTDVNVTEIYVGSTKSLRNRKAAHRCACNSPDNHNYNMQVYQYIRAHGGFKNWVMSTLDTMQYNEKHELRARERHWIEQLKATLNTQVPTRTKTEYYQANKEVILQQCQQYKLEHKEEVLAAAREYGRTHREEHKEYLKVYNQQNSEYIAQRRKEYYETNRESLLAQQAQRIICECGTDIAVGKRARHCKTKMHSELMAAKTIVPPDIVPVEHATQNPTQTF